VTPHFPHFNTNVQYSCYVLLQGIGAVVGVLSHNLADLYDLQKCQGGYISIYDQPNYAHQVSS
jgi:hypothetical protein